MNSLSPETLGLSIRLGALAASVAALAKLGILKSGNNFLSGLFSGGAGIKQKADAEAAIASERKLQAEAAKTAAVLELKNRLYEESLAKTELTNARQAREIAQSNYNNVVASGKLPIAEKRISLKPIMRLLRQRLRLPVQPRQPLPPLKRLQRQIPRLLSPQMLTRQQQRNQHRQQP